MTLNVTISIDQNQAYGLQINTITESESGENDLMECVAELQPGECFNLLMWEGMPFKGIEIPKVIKPVTKAE